MTSKAPEAASDRGLRISEVAERVGVSASTVRLWEERFGTAQPTRTGGGHRRYGESDVVRLTALRDLIEQGHRPGDAAKTLAAGGGVPNELVLATCRAVLHAPSIAAVTKALEAFVHSIGGAVTSDPSSADAVPIDLSFGAGTARYPAAPPLSVARLQVERALPSLIEDARVVVGWIRRSRRRA